MEGKETASRQDAMANRTYDAFLDAILTMFGKIKRTLHHGVGNGRRHIPHSMRLRCSFHWYTSLACSCVVTCGLWDHKQYKYTMTRLIFYELIIIYTQ